MGREEKRDTVGAYNIYSENLLVLAPGKELEGEIVNAYLAWIGAKAGVFIVDSYLMTSLWQGTHKGGLRKIAGLEKQTFSWEMGRHDPRYSTSCGVLVLKGGEVPKEYKITEEKVCSLVQREEVFQGLQKQEAVFAEIVNAYLAWIGAKAGVFIVDSYLMTSLWQGTHKGGLRKLRDGPARPSVFYILRCVGSEACRANTSENKGPVCSRPGRSGLMRFHMAMALVKNSVDLSQLCRACGELSSGHKVDQWITEEKVCSLVQREEVFQGLQKQEAVSAEVTTNMTKSREGDHRQVDNFQEARGEDPCQVKKSVGSFSSGWPLTSTSKPTPKPTPTSMTDCQARGASSDVETCNNPRHMGREEKRDTVGAYNIYSENLLVLAPGKELEGEIVNAYLAWIGAKAGVFIVDSYLMTSLWQGTHKGGLRKPEPSVTGHTGPSLSCIYFLTNIWLEDWDTPWIGYLYITG
ncbi:hypothetical protein KUCAC02_022673 [Chaenocephalus aceratus]|uniref:Uncharacterized protein n=1 Tax=Chaenocephalus aceratus TaxID=36190 RepID=A0ACB9XPR6_CHAAC|nr:hypothetical protein KUCAC02_022673 [Chaenocephalus aceratus]